ncbi:MAG: hypothetical protein SVU32_09305 [Candidatus Nanohaloarchaea archaeon]|nr:hypothetical protein [Candidatus Nanohaloarchaea archaeon]
MSPPPREYSLPDDHTAFEQEAFYDREPAIDMNDPKDEVETYEDQQLEDDGFFDDAFLEDVTKFLEKGYMGLTASMFLFGAGNAACSYMSGDYSDLAVSLFISATGARFAADAYRACQHPTQGRY